MSTELQIMALLLTAGTFLFTLFAWLVTKSKIEGEVLTKLAEQENDIKEIENKLDLVTIAKEEAHSAINEALGSVRERLAVIEFRTDSLDRQIQSCQKRPL